MKVSNKTFCSVSSRPWSNLLFNAYTQTVLYPRTNVIFPDLKRLRSVWSCILWSRHNTNVSCMTIKWRLLRQPFLIGCYFLILDNGWVMRNVSLLDMRDASNMFLFKNVLSVCRCWISRACFPVSGLAHWFSKTMVGYRKKNEWKILLNLWFKGVFIYILYSG